MPDFTSFSPWLNALLFLGGAAAVWGAGTRLAAHADTIAERTGLGQAMVGMLLLGGITSLPEIAVSVSASLAGNASLSVSNILGGVALQVVVIAIGDALLPGRPISSRIGQPTVLLQAVFSCLLLLLVAAGVLVGEVAVLGVGLWSTAVLVAGVLMFWLVSRYKGAERWKPLPEPEAPRIAADGAQDPAATTLRRAVLTTLALGAVILLGGSLLSLSGEAIAAQTGLGQAFTGAVLVGAATSLPEISTVVAAVRLRRYTMAFADIFGTNVFDLMLVFVVDVAYSGPPVLGEQGAFALFGAMLGIAVTLLYVAGLVERRDRTMLRLGWDSWAVVGTWIGGVVALYFLR